ncbi:aminopeptidase C [Lacticaseibacillus suilingensis]|jgi:bleomycin hydrolase|uniref:Aminopeptidase n=1 Tax=Lacticaseibacillus suilingensis TaxID=2799577 RepID=A0ABW4BH96_9LACO|nr:C1 family peptidase [Lacticaseibacillus suilingensis]MCI1894890.1 C1 family peptidase [Lactobacillus sp.]MCI1917230.1 C1 family peptidase [Lactobacillus sp.]MCI1973096.1 C1 family peptidase [Lactobacillus sp.]MCI2016654.1 C1 family peptidase [Lactobacillus sp.]MCI2037470.1 C1 family peptidase [Lactobacillus sp.]
MSKAVTAEDLAKYQADLENTPGSAAIQKAVMNNGVLKSSEDVHSQTTMEKTFSIDLSTGTVADQKQSGRCWMFAALNTMRHDIQQQFKIKGFELSQNFTFFWDKFEKSNYFYENVLKTAGEDIDSRKVAWLMANPQGDGGQWDMLTAIIDKYGIVPKSVMPETFSSSASGQMNKVLNLKLRKDAVTLRKLVADNASDEDIQAAKDKMLSEDYRILAYTLGVPPTKFDFEYRDDDKNYHIDRDLTPRTFYEKYIGWDTNAFQSLINAPTADKPYNHLYTVEMLGNVIGGREVRHLNLTVDNLKQLAIKQLENGETVWFGSDVGQSSDSKLGIMDPALFDKNGLFNANFDMTKADRLDYGESLMTHAMVITGVDIVDGQPTKWKVENSWGEKAGDKGYFVASDAWFDEFVYQVVINKKYLSQDLQDVIKNEYDHPTVLKPWDPMGALA